MPRRFHSPLGACVMSASKPSSAGPSVDIVVPELGLDPTERLTVSCWLVAPGETVVAGDRLIELLADRITYDIASPATGLLVRIRAEIDEPIRCGQVLGTIAVAESDRKL